MSMPNREQLLESLSRVNAIEDPIERELALTEEVLRLDLTAEGYRRLLLAQGEMEWTRFWLLRFLSRGLAGLERRLRGPIGWLKQLSIFQLSALIGQLTVLVATVSYFLDAPNRYQQRIRALRSEVTAAAGTRYSGTRIRSLHLLAESCEGWPGLELVGVDLAGIDLGPCPRLGLRSPALGEHLAAVVAERGFDLSHADLSRSVLRGARLWKAVLVGVRAEGADLRDADLRGADLRGADLRARSRRRPADRGCAARGAPGARAPRPCRARWRGPVRGGALSRRSRARLPARREPQPGAPHRREPQPRGPPRRGAVPRRPHARPPEQGRSAAGGPGQRQPRGGLP